MSKDKFIPYPCPNCGLPLDTIFWEVHTRYRLNTETGAYEEEKNFGGTGKVSCFHCGITLNDGEGSPFDEGPVNAGGFPIEELGK